MNRPPEKTEEECPPDHDIVEIVDQFLGEDGKVKMHIRYVNGLEVVRTVISASLEAQITRADGTVEPMQLLSKTTCNPVTNQRLRDEGVGEVTFKQ